MDQGDRWGSKWAVGPKHCVIAGIEVWKQGWGVEDAVTVPSPFEARPLQRIFPAVSKVTKLGRGVGRSEEWCGAKDGSEEWCE